MAYRFRGRHRDSVTSNRKAQPAQVVNLSCACYDGSMDTMKCTECGNEKQMGKFCISRTAVSGRCQPCCSCFHKRRIQNNPVYEQEQRERARARYAKNREDEKRKARERYHLRPQKPYCFGEKQRAREYLKGAVRRGSILKPSRCEECGEVFQKSKIHGHHSDYSKPYAVKWLCSICHGLEHRKRESSQEK